MAGFATQYTLAIVIQEISRGRAVSDAKKRLTDLGSTANTAGNQSLTAMERMKRGVRGVASAVGRVLTPALALAGVAAANWAKDAALEFAQYERSLREVYTLAPDLNKEAQEQIRNQIADTGVEYGRLTNETIPALYQAISLGISPDNAPRAVELASMAATAAVADLESTLITGVTIANAHGKGIDDLAHIYDVLQTMIRFGFIRMNEMNRVMGPLSKTAADSGTSLESVAAAMITLTRQGRNAQEAAELLHFFLLQLSTDGTAAFKAFEQASGTSYRRFIDGGGDLVEALVLMDEHAKETGQSLTTMIAGDSNFYRDQRAAQAAIGLTGESLKELVTQAENVENATGAVGVAFKEVSSDLQFDIDRAKAAWEELKLEFGRDLAEGFKIGAGRISTGTVARGATEFAKRSSGARARQIEEMVQTRLEAQETQEDMLKDLEAFQEAWRFAWLFKGGKEAVQAGIDQTTQSLFDQAESLEEAEQLLLDYGLATREVGTDAIYMAVGTKEIVSVLWEEAEAARAAAEEQERLAAAIEEAEGADRKFLERDVADAAPSVRVASPEQIAKQEQLNEQMARYNSLLGAAAIEQKDLTDASWLWSDAMIEFNNTVQEITTNLFDNYENLNRSEDEWFARYLEHAEQIGSISEDLAGSATLAQAFELTGEELDDAREEIGEALLEIKEAYNELGTSIVETQLLEKFGGESAQVEKQLIRLKEQMGSIDEDEADFLIAQIDTAEKLDRVLTSMLEEYLKLGGLSAEETAALANAIELVNSATELTDKGIIAMAESTATQTAAMTTAIDEGPTKASERLETKLTELDEGEWTPEVEVDPVDSDEKLTKLEEKLTHITNKDWVIKVRVQTSGSVPSGIGNTGLREFHHGGRFKVPELAQYQNDQFLAAFNAGEEVTVLTAGQQRARDRALRGSEAGGGSRIFTDNSRTTIINTNRQSANVALGWQSRQREKRINRTME